MQGGHVLFFSLPRSLCRVYLLSLSLSLSLYLVSRIRIQTLFSEKIMYCPSQKEEHWRVGLFQLPSQCWAMLMLRSDNANFTDVQPQYNTIVETFLQHRTESAETRSLSLSLSLPLSPSRSLLLLFSLSLSPSLPLALFVRVLVLSLYIYISTYIYIYILIHISYSCLYYFVY